MIGDGRTDEVTVAATSQTLVMDAVDRLQWRVTVGDVAAQTGLAIPQARQELMQLAQAADGHLQVADSGEIAYSFKKNFRSTLRQKEQRRKGAAFRQKLWGGFLYLLRISFGILLIVSIVLALIAITIIQSAANKDNNNGGSRRRGGGGFLFMPNIWVGNPFIGYRSPRRPVVSEKSEYNFLEAVYSFLFGDGDPNAELEQEQYCLIGQLISNQGGVVTGEQVLPYLSQVQAHELDYQDYILPVLLKFNGMPEVSPEGDIVYRFPELQVVAAKRRRESLPGFLRENLWRFSRASSGQLAMTGVLGVVNLLLWLIVAPNAPVLAAELGVGVGLINFGVTVLLAYAALFLAVPTLRWFTLKKRNLGVEGRNRQRQNYGAILSKPNADLERKLAFAETFAGKEIVDRDRTIYTTETDLLEQQASELEQFDRRLQR